MEALSTPFDAFCPPSRALLVKVQSRVQPLSSISAGCPCFVHPKSTLLHLKGTLLHHGDPFDAFRRLSPPSRALFGESTEPCSTTLIHFSPAQPLATPFNPAQPLATPFNPAQPFGNPFQACSTLWIALQPSRREATLFMHFHPSRAPSRALYLPSRGPFGPS